MPASLTTKAGDPRPTAAHGLISRLLRQTYGWIGIEVGSDAVKMAQLERRAGALSIASRWTAPLGLNEPLSVAHIESGLLGEARLGLRNSHTLFHGSSCAATLSMTTAQLRWLSLPSGVPEELREMAREEMAAELEDGQPLACGIVTMESDANGQSRVQAMTLSLACTRRLSRDLAGAGYECRILDALPCALARAVAMVDPSEQPAAILHLGDHAVTFTTAIQERPLFTRVLRGGGLQELLRPLGTSLGLNPQQAFEALRRFGIGGKGSAYANVQTGSSPLSDAVAAGATALVDELRRTLLYVGDKLRRELPQRLWLAGPGALLRGIEPYLAEQIDMPVCRWRLSESDDEADDDPLYAVAAALSALKWDPNRCT